MCGLSTVCVCVCGCRSTVLEYDARERQYTSLKMTHLKPKVDQNAENHLNALVRIPNARMSISLGVNAGSCDLRHTKEIFD